jgi:hypothetical protein
MDDDPSEYAQLASMSYKLGEQQNVGNWEFDPNVSNSSTSVFYNRDKNQVAFAHRGTDPSYWRDHAQNALLALGLTKVGNRYKRSEKATEDGMAKYSDATPIHVGHSAGGHTALLLANKFNQQGHVFNPAMSPWDKRSEIPKGVTVHHVLGDPISQMLHKPGNYLKENVRLYKPRGSPHSLNNFIGKRGYASYG